MEDNAAIKYGLTFEEAWPILQEEAINKLIYNVEGIKSYQFTSEDYMRFYTIVYQVCGADTLGSVVDKMYNQYRRTFEDHISYMALPSLRGKISENFLQELLKRWKIHKTMTKWLAGFFCYLDRYYTKSKMIPSLVASSYLAFYNLVYGEMNDKIRDTIISLIDRERKGGQIDQPLVKDVIDIYVEIGEGSAKYYEKNFEEEMKNATAKFYSRKALELIANESYEDYMLKVEFCINQEKARVLNYLKYTNIDKVSEIVEHELLKVHASKLEEKKRCYEAAALINRLYVNV